MTELDNLQSVEDDTFWLIKGVMAHVCQKCSVVLNKRNATALGEFQPYCDSCEDPNIEVARLKSLDEEHKNSPEYKEFLKEFETRK